MKFKYIFIILALLVLSCSKNDDDYEFVQVAVPQLMSKAVFRKSVEVKIPETIEQVGKIYAYKDYVFISDVNKGIHIIDNSKPELPKAIAYIVIPGNEDISVKNDFLYADSATDLLVFDISNINNVSMVERLEDVFDIYDYSIPIEAEDVDFNKVDFDTDIIVGWTLVTERRKKEIEPGTDVLFDGFSASESTGKGGSLARFQIVNNYLYTVGNNEMAIFNIQNLSEPVLTGTQYAGWNIETMFQAEDFLYLGSTNGMYIYDISKPTSPEYVSEFTHWEGCDPVVVDGNYAYLTLRGGNDCGQLESVLEVIDISDKSMPVLASRYELDNPYGLGIKDNTLFVCDGTSGLKLFDKKDPLNLTIIEAFKNIQAKDVIPLENSLLLIGDDALYQYKYVENSVELISTYVLK